ncbi:MAG TPA: class I SAM-dependent methyltransferase [Gammaproteobacteria bacterium]|nr:class I SAM-dependent methyltransferase [Gammaproteobacteria bacterium]
MRITRQTRTAGFRCPSRSIFSIERWWQALGRRFAAVYRARDQLELRAGQTALEFACGGATLTDVLSRQVGERGRVYVVETDARAVRRLNRRAVRQQMNNVVPLLLKELKLPLNTRSVDLVVVAEFFAWVEDTRTFFRELHRVIKPNGCLLLVRAGQAPEALRNEIESVRCWQIAGITNGVYTCTPRYVQLSPPPVERRKAVADAPTWPGDRERRRPGAPRPR